jgi:3-(3-hydroxy-phenyl)propionate hydroxylase
LKGQKMPAFINLQQYHAEEILVRGLRTLPNVEIRWGHEVTEVVPVPGQGIDLTVQAQDANYAIKAEWLVACDGSRSPVRGMLGLDFEGKVFEENFLIADIRLKDERPTERWFWFDPPFNRGQSALLHKQPDDFWRLDFQLGWNVDREASVKPENVERFVRGMLGKNVAFTEEWHSVYTFQCRRMKRFVHDRVIFAGDSAHLVSPFGARGCNGGLADIDNLGWKLDRVLCQEAPLELLESYNDEAVATAEENIRHSTRSTEFLTPKKPVSRAFRDAVLELAKNHTFARPFVNSGRLSTPVSYPDSALNTPDEASAAWGGVPPGSPAVDAQLGGDWLLNSLGNEFVLLANNWTEPVPSDVKLLDIAELDGVAQVVERYDLRPRSAYLIRPDQYVAARWRAPNFGAAAEALARATGGMRHYVPERAPRHVLDDPDEIYQRLIDLHDGLTDEESHIVNARLILLLANLVGDGGLVAEAIALKPAAREA